MSGEVFLQYADEISIAGSGEQNKSYLLPEIHAKWNMTLVARRVDSQAGGTRMQMDIIRKEVESNV